MRMSRRGQKGADPRPLQLAPRRSAISWEQRQQHPSDQRTSLPRKHGEQDEDQPREWNQGEYAIRSGECAAVSRELQKRRGEHDVDEPADEQRNVSERVPAKDLLGASRSRRPGKWGHERQDRQPGAASPRPADGHQRKLNARRCRLAVASANRSWFDRHPLRTIRDRGQQHTIDRFIGRRVSEITKNDFVSPSNRALNLHELQTKVAKLASGLGVVSRSSTAASGRRKGLWRGRF